MNFPTLSVLSLSLIILGCSSLYKAPSETSARQIFTEACAVCHKPRESNQDKFFSLTSDETNTEYVSDKIKNGGFIMPAFPNLDEQQLEAISEYVIDHSVIKQ